MKFPDRLVLAFLLCTFVVFTLVNLSKQNDEQKLFDALFANHKTSVRPVLHHNNSLVVKIGFTFIQIVQVEEQTQTVTMKVWYRLVWTNQLLTWKPKDWNGIERLLVNPELLWRPDIMLYDHIDERLMNSEINTNAMAELHFDGKIRWGRPLIFTTSCHIDVTYFPFDRQTCSLLFASWMHDRSMLDLKANNDPFITKQYINSSEWDMMHISGRIHIERYEGFSEDIAPTEYANYIVTYTLLRKPLYYMFNVLVPCVILMSIILIGFFFPIDSGERISIVITILLTYTVFLDIVNAALPTTSVSVPVLSLFYITIIVESAISLVATCVVLIVHHRGDEKGVAPVPSWIRRYMYSEYVINYLGIIHSDVKDYGKENDSQRAGGIDNASCNHGTASSNMFNLCDKSTDSPVHQQLRNMNQALKDDQLPAVEASYTILENILKEVGRISSTLNDSRGDEIEGEWKYLAKILDRLFFFFFTFLFFITSVSILAPAYAFTQHEDN